MKNFGSHHRTVLVVVSVVALHCVGLGFLSFLERPYFSENNRVAVKVVVVTPTPVVVPRHVQTKNEPTVNSVKKIELSSRLLSEQFVSQRISKRGIDSTESLPTPSSSSKEPTQPISFPALTIVYPARAKRLGIEGRVVVRVQSLDSKLTTHIVQSSGFEVLDAAVKKTISTPKFETDFFSQAANESVLLTVDFRLNDISPVKTRVLPENR